MKQRNSLSLHVTLIIAATLISNFGALAQPLTPLQRRKNSTTVATRTASATTAAATTTTVANVTIKSEPNAQVWIDDIKRGVTDANGTLTIKKLSGGSRGVRVRASGFSEKTQAVRLLSNQTINVKLAPTTDAAELAFQQAETAREQGGTNLPNAIEAYRKAIALRPRFAAAHLGLARALADSGDAEAALEQIKLARQARPVYPEASAVEGRIYRAQGDTDNAVESFNRAIKEARGRQPEAYTGLGLLYESQDQHAAAIPLFQKAIAQLDDTEPVLYQLLGSAYEQTEKYKEAVAVYEKYLQLAPEGKFASAIKSMLEQLRRQAAGENVLQP